MHAEEYTNLYSNAKTVQPLTRDLVEELSARSSVDVLEDADIQEALKAYMDYTQLVFVQTPPTVNQLEAMNAAGTSTIYPQKTLRSRTYHRSVFNK